MVSVHCYALLLRHFGTVNWVWLLSVVCQQALPDIHGIKNIVYIVHLYLFNVKIWIQIFHMGKIDSLPKRGNIFKCTKNSYFNPLFVTVLSARHLLHFLETSKEENSFCTLESLFLRRKVKVAPSFYHFSHGCDQKYNLQVRKEGSESSRKQRGDLLVSKTWQLLNTI